MSDDWLRGSPATFRAEDYSARLRRVADEREERVARRLYAAWNENLNQADWSHAQDGTRWKWRRLARIAIAELVK